MLLKDQIAELEIIDESESTKRWIWLNNFKATDFTIASISLEEFYFAYSKAKIFLGFKENETSSPQYWSPSSASTTCFSPTSPISYQSEIGEAIARALSSFSLSVKRSHEEQQSLTAFLDAEYAYLSTYFSIDTKAYGKNEIQWIKEFSDKAYLQHCLTWFLFSFQDANSVNVTNLLFLTLNQLINSYFKDPAHLLLDILIKKLKIENSLQNDFYFKAILKCLLSGKTPYPFLNKISMIVLNLSIAIQTQYEEVLVHYLKRLKYAKEKSESPEALAQFINITNEFLRYELLKLRTWLWSEHVISELSVGALKVRPFANSKSAITNGKEFLVECELHNILKILEELEIAPNPIQLLIACKLIATEPLNRDSKTSKTKYLLVQKPLLKRLYAFFADTSKADFGEDTAPRLNLALWEPINHCMEEISSELRRPEKQSFLNLASLKENIASFFQRSAFERGITAARQSITDVRGARSKPKEESQTFYSGCRVEAIDI